MPKNVIPFVLAFASIVGAGSALQAGQGETVPQFSAAPRAGTVVELAPGTKIDLQNMAELTPLELEKALENPTCGGNRADKSATHCAACTGFNCTGACFLIPCGTLVNANEVVPPQIGFVSFVTGCNTTYVSTCNDLGTEGDCRGYSFSSASWGNNTCVNSNTYVLKSVACL